jgi:adenine phosphoribosyltransferase
MLRKKGKLPGATVRYTYALEYGTDTIEVQEGAIKPGERVVVLDDLLATGGTMAAAIHLLRLLKAEVVAAAFIIELNFLSGRKKLDVPVESLLQYDS